MSDTFDYDLFTTLQGIALAEYMEPVLRNKDDLVSEQVIGRVYSELPNYDAFHLAYALQLGYNHRPDLFLPVMPRYLAHPEAGVCCTAYNILDQLPGDLVSEELLEAVTAITNAGLKWRGLAAIVTTLKRRTGR